MKQLLSVLTLCAFAFIYPLAGSAATTFLWNVVSPGANNWNVNANWTPSTGNPGATDTAIFGTTGTSGASTVVNNVVTVNTTVAALTFTNNTGGAWHVTQIPSGVTLTVTNFTAGGLVVDGITTSAAMVDGGTLLVTGNFTNANTGTAASSSSSTLDLSGLSNFVYSASAGTFNLGANGSRSIGNLTSAAASNSITAATILFETSASSSSVTGTWNLGAGTNRINANTINVGSQRSGGAVQFNTVSGGLRVRGTGGTDSDRANITLGNRNAGGTSGTSYGRLFLNDHPVDLKAGTLTVGQCSQATPVTGSALVELNAGILDATTINMAINSSSGTGNGTITVGTNSTLGTNGLLIIGGGGLSMANQTGSGVANGTNNINGGVVRCFGNIRKTTSSGTASITISSGGHLNMAALTNTIGSAAIPVDNLTLTDGTMTLPVFNANASATVNTLNIFGSADTINVSTVPGLGQFKLIAYTTLNGTFDFNLGSLPAGYQGYISNNVAGLSVDLVITSTVAKIDTWRGNISGNWDTSTANWISSANPANYSDGDIVIFDDSLTGTPAVSVTAARAPGQVSINNSSATYVFTGSGKITGTTSLTKDGTGSATLSGTGGDDFAGGVIVNNGTLILDETNSAISGGVAINGGTLRVGNNDGNGALPSGSITDNGTLSFGRTNDITVATAVSGTGGLFQGGSGKLILTGANTYSGATFVLSGTLALAGSGTISNSAQLLLSNSTFDISALGQQTVLNNLNMTNATLVMGVNTGTTNISTTTLTTGGFTNLINITSLPPIASYPVTFTLIQDSIVGAPSNIGLGSLPPASPAYAGTISQNGSQTAILLTLTSGPIGTRPSVSWTGGDVPNLNTNWSDRLNWQLPGAPVPGDVVLFDNNGTGFSSALSTPGGGSSALIPGSFNNIADGSFFLSSLTFTNNGGSYHNTGIANGGLISVTNSGGLTVGAYDAGGTVQQEFVTVSGSNARLVVSNSAANVNVWVGSPNIASDQAVLDLSALDTFSATVSRFLAGASIGNVVNRPSGIVYLAKTNTISAAFQTTTIENGTTTANAAIVAADCNGNPGARSFIYLGQVNTISADTIAIGRQKAPGDLRFNPIYANVAPYPSVTIHGFSSGRVSIFDIADGVANSGTTAFIANTDLSGGIVTASIDTLNVGRASTAGTGANATTGNLTFDAGTIDANTINLGLQPTNNAKMGVGTANVASNSVIGAGATLIARTTLNLGNANGGAGAASTSGTLNITNGTVLANNIIPGANSQSTITLAGGRLFITNAIGNSTAPLTTLNLASLGTPDNSGTLMQIPAPGITVSTLNVDGLTTTTNVINVSTIGNLLSLPAEVPLIQYIAGMNVFGGTFNIGLGTLPAGYSGYITNDTASSMVGLVITGAPPKPPFITSFSLQSGNLVATGTNGYAGATYYVLGSTNVMLPRNLWTPITTNTFDGSGNFSVSIPLDPTKPQRFFTLQVPQG